METLRNSLDLFELSSAPNVNLGNISDILQCKFVYCLNLGPNLYITWSKESAYICNFGGINSNQKDAILMPILKNAGP